VNSNARLDVVEVVDAVARRHLLTLRHKVMTHRVGQANGNHVVQYSIQPVCLDDAAGITCVSDGGGKRPVSAARSYAQGSLAGGRVTTVMRSSRLSGYTRSPTSFWNEWRLAPIVVLPSPLLGTRRLQ
jgi:hypothetical protein